MSLTRAQYIQGDSSKGEVLAGEVQGVKEGPGTRIAPDGTISFSPETSTGVVKLNSTTAYNGYIWPNQPGTADTFMGVNQQGDLAWLPPPGLVQLGNAPASPKLGQLWFDYSTNLTYVYQNKGGANSWYPVYRGLEVVSSLCVSLPAFSSGSGSEAAPFIVESTTTRSGNTVLFPSTITISGLAPFQFLPIVDINTSENDFRFQPTNTFADANGNLTFKIKYTDYPQTPPGTAYTAMFRVGFDSPIFIEASVGITFPVRIDNPGSITGTPVIGEVLNYSVGVASGGTPPYTYTWEWKTESGGQVLQTNGNSYVVGSQTYNDRVYVRLTATDDTLDRAEGNTGSFPAPPEFISKGLFPITNILFPTSLTEAATTVWGDAGTTLRASGCIEFSVDGVSFSQGPTVIANGGTITVRWITSLSCSGATNGTNITGCVYSNDYEECSTLHIDRVPSPFSFSPATNVPPSAVVASNSIVPVGYNATAYVTYSGSSTGTNIQASLDSGSTWVNVPLSGSTSLPVNPGNSLRVRMTVGADFSANYSAIINIGEGSVVQSGTFTATTEGANSFTTAISFPTITTAEVASPAWVDGSTSLSATGCIQFKVGVGGSWNGAGDPPAAITNGAILYTRWNGGTPGICGQAPHGTTITGSITNVPSGGTKTSLASLTIDRVPASFSFTNLTGQAISSVIESNTISITGNNAPSFLTYDTSTSTLTSIQARIGGGSWVSIPSSGETLSIAPVASGPGTTLQIRGTTGSSQGQTYLAEVDAGQSTSVQSSIWSVTTSSLVPSVATPNIVSPVNGATNVNPNSVSPAGVTITSSTYSGLNGAGSQVSSDWEIYYLSGSTPVYIVQSNNDTSNLQSYFLPLSLLGSATTYFVRVRYRTNTPTTVVSNWSNVSQFTIVTPSIATPSVTSPVNGSTNVNPYWFLNGLTLSGSSYTPLNGAGSFAGSLWEVRRDSTSGTLVVSASSGQTTYNLASNLLSTSVNYFVRCRYVSSDPTPVESSWSPWISFQTTSNFNLLNWQQTDSVLQGTVLPNARRPVGLTSYTYSGSTSTVAFFGDATGSSGNIISSINTTFPFGSNPVAVPLLSVSGYATGAPALAPGLNMLVTIGGAIVPGSGANPNGAAVLQQFVGWLPSAQFPSTPYSVQGTGIAYGSGVFVIVTSRNLIFRTTDPRPTGSWSLIQPSLPPTTDPSGYTFTSITWESLFNRFSASCYTTDNGTIKCYILNSSDGITWTRTLAMTGNYILKLVYSPDYNSTNQRGYIALASNGVLYGDGQASWSLVPGLPTGFAGNGDITLGGGFIVLTTMQKCYSARRGVWPPVFAEMANPFVGNSTNYIAIDGPAAGGPPVPYYLTSGPGPVSGSSSFTSLYNGVTYQGGISPTTYYNHSFYMVLS